MLDPNTPLQLTVPAAAFDVIMRSLGEQPWRVVDPIIDMLKQQVTEAHPGAFDTAPPSQSNGIDHAVAVS